MGFHRGALLVALGVVVANASIAQTCDAQEAARLRAHLEQQSVRVERWNTAWRGIYSVAAIGSAALAAANPFPASQDSLWVSAAKAALGTMSRWLFALRVDVPSPRADACEDVAALRAAVASLAKQEKQVFWLHQIGSIVVNAAGSIVLALRKAPIEQTLGSFAIGYAVAAIATYTMPRATWHLWRDMTVAPNGTGVTLGGTF